MHLVQDLEDIAPALGQGTKHFNLSAIAYMSWIRLLQAVESTRVSASLIFRLDEKRRVSMEVSNGQVIDLSLFGRGFDNFDFLLHCRHLVRLVFYKTDDILLHTGYLPSTLREFSASGDRDSESVVDLGFCDSFRSLETLNLREVRIKNESALTSCRKLQHLDIIGCELNDLRYIGQLTGLKSLGIFRNNVKDLTPIRHLIEKGIPVVNDNHPVHRGRSEDHKYFIAVAGNPLEQPPIDIVIMGNWAVLAYLDGRRTFNGVKRELEVEGTRLELEVPFEVLAEGEERVKDYLRDVNKVFRHHQYYKARTGRSELFNITPLNP